MASTAQSIQTDILGQIFLGLKSRHHETRLQSAVELHRYVRTPRVGLRILNGEMPGRNYCRGNVV